MHMIWEALNEAVVSALFMSALVALMFFFFYAPEIERFVVKQTQNVARALADDLTTFAPDALSLGVADRMSMGGDVVSKQDAQIAIANDKLRTQTFLHVGVGAGLLLGWAWVGSMVQMFPLGKNLVAIVCAALVQVAFVKGVMQNHIAVDINFVRRRMVQMLKKKYQT